MRVRRRIAPMRQKRNGRAWEPMAAICAALLVSVTLIASAQEPFAAANDASNDSASAICPIVYQVDQGVPSSRGYRYLFYGNGFFVDAQGYVLTAAHVLSQLHGGQPFLLLRDAAAKVHFVKADVAAIDIGHDVAVLRAEPNPFADKTFAGGAISFLPLDAADAQPGEMVRAGSFIPSDPRDAFSLDPIREDRSPGEVLRIEFSQLEKGAADTELFLFNHTIEPGQSGSPVVSDSSRGVAGLVEGQWLRDSSAVFAELSVRETGIGAPSAKGVASVPGAAVPIHYAIALLQQKGIAWQPTTHMPVAHANDSTAGDLAKSPSFSGPVPLSLVATAYPAQSLFGGEVLLDAAVGQNGMLSDIRVVHGDEPFLGEALDAARTWAFLPTKDTRRASEERIGIAFQFPQPYVPPRRATVHHYDGAVTKGESLSGDGAGGDTTAPMAVTTAEPEYPIANGSRSEPDGSVVLYETIDREGSVANVETLSGAEPLRSVALAAANQWKFAPAKRSGQAIESVAIIVVIFRQPLNAASGGPRCAIKMCGERACVACNPPANATQTKSGITSP